MPESPSLPTSHFYESVRLRLHYVDWGNEEAPPLLLIHGGRDHARMWDDVAGALRGDYHVMAVDLRGHGDSAWTSAPAYHVDDFVFDIAELIHQRALAPLTIIGHSLGGVVSLRYSGIYPQNVVRLVAIEGLGMGRRRRDASRGAEPAPARHRRFIERMREIQGWAPRRYESLEDALARMREANAHLSPELARHLTEHGTRRNEDGSLSWKFDPYFFSRFAAPSGLDPAEAREIWANIACPTLLVRGGDSWAADPRDDGSAEAFRDARIVTIPGAGHWVQHDRFDELTALVKKFLAG